MIPLSYCTFPSLWAEIADRYSPRQLEFWGTLIVQVVFFWVPALAFTALDYVLPSFSARHKIQPAPKQPTAAEIRHCALIVFRNQLQSIATALLFQAAADLKGEPSRFRITATAPPWSEVARDFVSCLILREIMFYYAHRSLHTGRLYRMIHKVHHEFTAPVALTAQYAHPVEHLVANTLPVALPPLILGSHILTMWSFVAFVLVETATVHSGYDFLAGIARSHDAHHEKFNVHFGAYGWMDWLHATHKTRRRRKAE